MAKLIRFEQPLNERIRTLLRLEHLFAKAEYWGNGESAWHSRAMLDTLFEIQNVLGRVDLGKDLIKDLERKAETLTRLEQNPNVDHAMLTSVLDSIDVVLDRLHTNGNTPGQLARENEFLNTIRQRSTIAGGNCDFDLPAFHQWLRLPAVTRASAIQRWFADYLPLRDGIRMLLGLIRDSATKTPQVAEAGFFQQSLDASIPYQLIRVSLPADHPCFAEISAGKHRFTIRFMSTDDLAKRPQQVSDDISFYLSCCQL